ncbi:MAG: hypothetical protein WAU11_00530 [Ignavibacteriaceae bacterium]
MPDQKTEEQKHYENLITFYKYTLGIFGVILVFLLGVAGYFLGKNISDVKSNITESVKPTIEGFNKTFELLEKNSNAQKELTEKRIDLLKIQTENLVIEESRKRIEQAFSENNIQVLLEETAQTELEPRIRQLSQDKVNEITNYFSELTELLPKSILSVDRIRFSHRDGLDTLSNIIARTNDSRIKKFFSQLLFEKTKEWEQSATENYSKVGLKEKLNNLNIPFVSIPDEKKDIIEKLIYIIQIEQNLDRLSIAFLSLRELLEDDTIKFFDKNSAETTANKYLKSKTK